MAALITKRSTSSRQKRPLLSEINITPFVDVMLVLLVVFMVTAPMMISGINVNLPQATTAPIAGDDEPLTITITDKEIIYLQDVAIEASELVPKLIAVTKEKKDSRILVRGDKNVSYGAIMNAVAAINNAGFNHISLITQMEEK